MKKTKTTMLEYCKLILQRVQFDKRLWRKEYRKSLLRLSATESRELKYWARKQYSVPMIQPISADHHG
jgi:hypothetical protein